MVRYLLALTLVLAGCVTVRQVDPPTTATEQLLITTAVDRAAARLQLPLLYERKVFVDTANLDLDGTIIYPKYAIAVVRSKLARMGGRLVAERNQADVVVELRSGAQSLNDRHMLLGLPSFSVPVPLAGNLAIPELPLFKYQRQTGHSKLGLVAYDRDGRIIADTGAQYGESLQSKWTLLFLLSYSSDDTESRDTHPH